MICDTVPFVKTILIGVPYCVAHLHVVTTNSTTNLFTNLFTNSIPHRVAYCIFFLCYNGAQLFSNERTKSRTLRSAIVQQRIPYSYTYQMSIFLPNGERLSCMIATLIFDMMK